MNEYPNRKTIRLTNYDYSSNGIYHVTICTRDKACIFGAINDYRMFLNDAGKVAEEDLLSIPHHYAGVEVVSYVVMPNHVHLLLRLCDGEVGENAADAKNGVPTARRSLGQIVGAYKAGVSRKLGRAIWQARFYEHIIRGERDYLDTIAYIQNNPVAWDKDDYFTLP